VLSSTKVMDYVNYILTAVICSCEGALDAHANKERGNILSSEGETSGFIATCCFLRQRQFRQVLIAGDSALQIVGILRARSACFGALLVHSSVRMG
jgi:hypothetical protein